MKVTQMLNVATDEVVDHTTHDVDHATPDLEEKQKEGQEMRRFASNLVESVVTKVKDEIYPAYLQMLEGESVDESVSGEPTKVEMLEHLYDEGGLERPETGIDPELVMAAKATSSPRVEGSRRRSVRFSFDDAVIPTDEDMEVLGLDTLCLKPVAEHHVTPVPSPVPYQMRECSFGYVGNNAEDKPAKGLAESLLLRLLDDVNNCRLDKEELIKVTCYCMEIPRGSESTERKTAFESDKQSDISLSTRVIDDLVEFTLGRILDEVKSGEVDTDDVTALTISVVSDKHNNSGFYVSKSGKDLNVSSESRSSTTVNQTGAEIINQTIVTIKEGKLSRYYLQELAYELSEDQGNSASPRISHSKRSSTTSLDTFVVGVLEELQSDIRKGFVNSQIIENVIQQLAMLSVEKNNSCLEQDVGVLSSVEMLDLIKCALGRTVSDAVGDPDTQFHPAESCEKGCSCPAASGVVKCSLSHTVNDDTDLNPKHTGLDHKHVGIPPGSQGSVTRAPLEPSSTDAVSVITVNSQWSDPVGAGGPEGRSQSAEATRTNIQHGFHKVKVTISSSPDLEDSTK